jgi:SSS family solute:Na+ symporter
MSSVDSGMHSIATTLTNDVYSKLCPGANDGTQLAVARIITVLAGLCGVLAAVFLTIFGLDRGSLWDLLLQVIIPIGSSLAGVFMLGVLTRRTTWYGAAAGVVVSMPMVVWFALTKNSPLPHPILKAAAGVLICMLVGYLVSLAIPGPGRPLRNLTLHTMVKEKENGKQEATNE